MADNSLRETPTLRRGGADSQEYLFDHAQRTELVRLRALSAVCDPWTIQVLKRIRPRPGWRCLDVGSGAGSIAQWLAQRVAPPGEVVAADLDTVFLEPLASPTLRVLQHDILTGPVERRAFDLVHARYLLEWLQPWEVGLDHLLASVKPGGVIVLADIDWQTLVPAPASLDAFFAAFAVVMQQHGRWDPGCGRWLAERLEAHGVHDVQAELHAARVRGGSVGIDWARLSIAPLRRGLLEVGGLDEATLQTAAATLADPATSIWLPAMVAAWGTVP